ERWPRAARSSARVSSSIMAASPVAIIFGAIFFPAEHYRGAMPLPRKNAGQFGSSAVNQEVALGIAGQIVGAAGAADHVLNVLTAAAAPLLTLVAESVWRLTAMETRVHASAFRDRVAVSDASQKRWRVFRRFCEASLTAIGNSKMRYRAANPGASAPPSVQTFGDKALSGFGGVVERSRTG